MEMYMSMASLILGLAQIPFLMLLFRRARRLGRGQGWCYRDLQRVLRRLAAVESSVTDMKEEQEQLRDRLEEAFVWLPPSWTCSLRRKKIWPRSPRAWRISWATPLRPDGRRHEACYRTTGLGPVLPGGGV